MRFPVFIEMEKKKVVVFGCGNIGMRRIKALYEYGADLTVIAPKIPEELRQMDVTCLEKKAEETDIAGAELVLTATNDSEVNHQVYQWCKAAGIPVNRSDCKEECDFYFPGLARSGDLVAGICAGGKDHKKARKAAEAVRELLKETFPEEKRTIVIGSRESKLAVIQTQLVLDAIREKHPEITFEHKTMKTTGDKILDRRLDQVGGKGLFVKELDQKLAAEEVDYTVHSLKDMPMEQPEGMPVIAVYKRGDSRDVLCYPEKFKGVMEKNPDELSDEEAEFVRRVTTGKGLRIGTSSLRRSLQLAKIYPDAEFLMIRGNVQTRLRKLDEGQYDMIVLAAAGLLRLDLGERISRYLTPEEVIPAAGQAILAVQGREKDDHTVMRSIHDERTWVEALAERSFVRFLDGGCSSPTAAHAEYEGETLKLTGLYYDEEKKEVRTGVITGQAAQAAELGVRLAKQLRDQKPEVADE